MIVYIESNFVLELALEQEQVGFADTILGLAEQGSIELIIPSTGLSEPFTAVMNFGNQRRLVLDGLERQSILLRRARQHQALVADIDSLYNSLNKIEETDTKKLTLVADRILRICRIAELDSNVFKQVQSYSVLYELHPKDSMIYATVVADLMQRPADELKCFTSRDARAFLDPAIKEELRAYNCRVITSFDQALSYIQSVIGA